MCETMTNGALEENPSYVLTEDMIDAAMTEQFNFQDGAESEEDQSSQDENMEVEMQSSSNEETSDKELNTSDSNKEQLNESDLLSSMNRVVIIDTGFDQTEPNSENVNDNASAGPDKSVDIELPLDTGSSNDKSDCNGIGDPQANEAEITNNLPDDAAVKDDILPILKQILTEEQPNCNEDTLGCIESIDLCGSDTDELSADEMPGGEVIDDALKTVMENNLMAEIGITVGKEIPTDIHEEAIPTDTVLPQISVKNIGHISTNDFNKIPGSSASDVPRVTLERRRNSDNPYPSTPEVSMAGKDKITNLIHINKIAVPNQTFVNNQGQRMKCVYVRTPSSVPHALSSSNNQQSLLANKNIKYLLAPSLKKGPIHVSSLAPTIANLPKVSSFKPIQPKPSGPKKFSIATKLMKGPTLLKTSSQSHRFDMDQNDDSLIKSLLFHGLKTPYVPMESHSSTQTTYGCANCNDRFIIESSLTQHLARRSMVIVYWCRICKLDLQFYNRCIFFNHLRKHNISLKTIDTACINFNPISKEMVDAGLISKNFKESSDTFPKKDRILKNRDTLDLVKKVTTNASSGSMGEKVVSSTNSINNNNKTAVATSSYSFNKALPLNSKLMGSSTLGTSVSTATPAQLLNRPTTLQNQLVPKLSQNHDHAMKSTKNTILFCNRQSVSTDSSSQTTNAIPPNVVCEMKTTENSEHVNNDSLLITNNINAEVNVKNQTVGNNMLHSSYSPRHLTKKSKSGTNKPKAQQQNNSLTTSAKRHCLECNMNCVNISKHLNGSNRPLNPLLSCEVCQLILPTRCALKVHRRIHMRIPPYKCPDCGKDFTAWEELNAHLKFSCGHLAKCVRYICIACKTNFPSTDDLSSHITSQHSKDIFKCTSCPVAFYTRPSLIKHLLTHSENSAVGIDYKQCSICPKKVVPNDKYKDHVEEHIKNKAIMVYAYKCPMCSILFTNKMPFIIHQIKEKTEMESKCDQMENGSRAKSGLKLNSHQDHNSDIEEEPEIISKYPEEANEPNDEKDPLSLDDWECAQGQTVNEKREELCIVCKENYVVLLPEIDLNKQSLCCRQCVRPLDELTDKQSKQFRKSKSRYHNIESKKRKTSPKNKRLSEVLIKNENEDMSDELTSDSTPPKKKSKKKPSRDVTDSTDPTHIQGQVITSKSANELACSKCDFVAEVRTVFLEHISIHRTDPNTFQCLECGLCFVVLPSLERHLQMHHAIKDVNDYTEKNTYCLPQKSALLDEEEEDEEEIVVDENQCRVCRQSFDSRPSLEKHFRTHGMAFMNSLSKSP